MKDTCFALLSQAEAVASDGDGRQVVQQLVQDGGRQYPVGDDIIPLAGLWRLRPGFYLNG